MNKDKALFPIVKNEIDFNVLLEQVHTALEAYSGNVWTDRREHDPGITFLEAISYVVSDLSYRSSLSINDLLTPEPSLQKEGIFPLDFGPHKALTSSPITIDDYRRGILDIHGSDKLGEETGVYSHFLFTDAYLVKEPTEESYRYWFDPNSHSFTFIKPESETKAAQEFVLLGNYHLYICESRHIIRDAKARAWADKVLNHYINTQRNLCERISNIIKFSMKDCNLKFDIELEEDCQDPVQVMADIFTAVDHYITPVSKRYRQEELVKMGMNNENIYLGPELNHGCIPELPTVRYKHNEKQAINLSPLVTIISNINGVSHIISLDSGGPDKWLWENDELLTMPFVWGKYAYDIIKSVRLYKKGQLYADIPQTEFEAKRFKEQVIIEQPYTIPYGKWRNPAKYYPVSDKIPTCYGLQNITPSEQERQLHQFLLPFEQHLANGCAQLALVSKLLNFDRDAGSAVWGMQWPFAEDSISNEVHQTYRASISSYLAKQSIDHTKELNIINYLLSYFGASRAPQTLNTDTDEFLAIQQGYLRRQTDLAYQRTNIQIDQVSAIQQRIAARLGIGAELFDPDTPLDQLSFYLIENGELLPTQPDSKYDVPQSLTKVELKDSELHFTSSATISILRGQLIDLIVDTQSDYNLRGLVVSRVEEDGKIFVITLADHAALINRIDDILAAQNAGTLRWQNCSSWLMEMSYAFNYAEDQSGVTEKQVRLQTTDTSPFPIRAEVDDKITLFYSTSDESNFNSPRAQAMEATIVKLDLINGVYVIESEGDWPTKEQANHYHWYLDKPIEDQFSFTISIVFNKNLITDINEPNLTEQWIKQVVYEEIPAHIRTQLHWLTEYQFKDFSMSYKKWQNNGTPLGDHAYTLLQLLSLGMKPELMLGIGLMRIATPAQKSEVIGVKGDEWNTEIIDKYSLFYIPPTL